MAQNTDTFSVLGAALADQYELIKEAGRGGMATVYQARDLKHDRDVAIKVLHRDLGASIGPDRFLREIKVAANLQHPNILPLFDSGQAAGLLYYVMPFVEGESLADRLESEGQLSVEFAVQVTREVAEALDHAHKHGIIHRDIKPDNVMLVGKHATVADFGISRAVEAGQGESLTQTGMAVGTPLYMSPEQAAGEKIDGRADIYSLGCMLYELLAGEPPFTGKTPSAIMARHAMEDLPDIRIVRPTVPDELQDAIDQATAKTPADRYATAGEFAESLGEAQLIVSSERLTARRTAQRRTHPPKRTKKATSRGVLLGAAAVAVLAIAAWRLWPAPGSTVGAMEVTGLDPTGVAVLYFDDLSPGGDYQFVADGLTEGLIEKLSQVRALDVISRNGVAPYRGGEISRDSIARALSVGSLIVGSVERVGDRLSVTTRLLDGGSGAEIGRSGFEISGDDLVAVQDSVAQQVSLILRERLGEEVRLREQRAGSRNAEAVSLLLLGERLRKDAEALVEIDSVDAGFITFDRADSVLAVAELADPNWASPVALRSEIAYRRSRLADGQRDMFNWIDVGLGHANRALALDPNDPSALETRGTLQYWAYLIDKEPDPAESQKLLDAAQVDLERAVELDPGLASAFATLSHLYYQTDDGTTSVVLAASRAYQEDAYLTSAAVILNRLFLGHYDLQEFSQAQRWCTVAAERFPDDFRFKKCRLWLMTTPAGQPNVDEAWRTWSELVPLVPLPDREYEERWAKMIVGGILAQAGLPDSARSVLLAARPTPDFDPLRELAWLEAYIRVILGDNDEAIELLKAFLVANPQDEPEADARIYWWWRDLEDHPRFGQVRAALTA